MVLAILDSDDAAKLRKLGLGHMLDRLIGRERPGPHVRADPVVPADAGLANYEVIEIEVVGENERRGELPLFFDCC